MTQNCQCGVEAAQFTVKKDGPNKGRKFYTCKTRTCKYFEWVDSNNYNPGRFKNGTCFRCGKWGHYDEGDGDCQETNDFFGNKIPDNYQDFI